MIHGLCRDVREDALDVVEGLTVATCSRGDGREFLFCCLLRSRLIVSLFAGCGGRSGGRLPANTTVSLE